jgi:predicted NAD/FAD-dependent oxidoreductase
MWFRTARAPDEGEPRFVGIGGMRTIPEHLAEGLDLRTGVTISGVGQAAASIVAVANNGEAIEAAGVILTPPVPQLLALVDAGDLEVPTEVRSRLEAVRYHACLAVMAELDGPSGLPRGHRSAVEGPIAWLGDNQDKGTSTTPALTIHSSARFAAEHLEGDPDDWTRSLCAAAAGHIDATIIQASGHRWCFAKPHTTFADGAIALAGDAHVILAGEVFARAKVEGAFLSGLAAADHILATR